MRQLIASLVLIIVSCPLLAQETWILLSKVKTITYEARYGSLERATTNVTKDPVIAVIIRSTNTVSGQITFEKDYVTLADCQAGYGKVVTTNLDGQAQYSNDFVIGGGSAASTIAETLCAVAAESGKTKS